jgi:DNA polymerase
MPKLVAQWRNANKKIVELWSRVESAAFEVIESGSRKPVVLGPVTFRLGPAGELEVWLPAGRPLVYQKARIEEDPRWGRPSIYYDGLLSETKAWGRVNTYGGKLTENIVQAIARDCLAEALLRLDVAGYRTVMHVHDEAVCEVPLEQADAKDRMCDIMGMPLPWAPGLPLCAAGFECEFYQKD